MRKIVLVTGGSRGIGAATAKLAARRGYDVCVNYVQSRDAAEAVVAEIHRTSDGGGGRAIAVKADVSPFDGSDVVVAILDTGIAKNHPAFAGVTIIEEDFTGEGNGDTHGHGTHCAGTVFGRDVDGTRIGVAPGVKKALIGKVLGDEGGGSDAIVRAINWALEEGANVISMSLGIDFPGFVDALVTRQGLPIDLATTMVR